MGQGSKVIRGVRRVWVLRGNNYDEENTCSTVNKRIDGNLI